MFKEGLCRPDDNHWCVECCPKDCCLLVDTRDGRQGCDAHGGKLSKYGLPQRAICQENECLELRTKGPEEREAVRRAIINSPLGQFRMSDFLKRR